MIDERGFFWWSDIAVPPKHFGPESGTYGRLLVTHDGEIKLHLDNFLNDGQQKYEGFMQNGQGTGRSISGILIKTSKHIHLLYVRFNGSTLSSYGPSFQSFSASTCLVGDRPFANRALIPGIRRIDVSLAGYEDWVALRNIKSRRNRRVIKIEHRIPDDLQYDIEQGSLILSYDIRGPMFGSISQDKIELKETARLVFKPKHAITVDDAVKFYSNVQNFMTIVSNSERTMEFPIVYGVSFQLGTQIIFNRRKITQDNFTWADYWTFVPRLKDNFGNIFSKFLRLSDEYGPGFYLYLSTRKGMSQYSEHKFASLAWGVEALHRTKSGNSNVKLQNKIDRILSYLPDGRDKKWLAGRLKNAGEPSLEERILDVLSPLPFGIQQPALRAFSSICAKRRNDISHFGQIRDQLDRDTVYRDLEILTKALGYLYHLRIMQIIGVGDELLRWIFFTRHASFRLREWLWRAKIIEMEEGFEGPQIS